MMSVAGLLEHLPGVDVGAVLGARRPSVNRVVSELQVRRLIGVGYRLITGLDATALLAQARQSTERPN